MSRYLAIGDIHGCLTAFNTLLDFVQVQPEDTMITLGDYVDRGPQTRGVIERLIELTTSHSLITLRGNHEILMLFARESESNFRRWISAGGDAVQKSYDLPDSDGPRVLDQIPAEHWTFLKRNLLAYWETETHFFVHANADPEIELAEQPDEILYWERFNYPTRHRSGKIMVCGHSAQKSGLPICTEHAVCNDTKAYGGGWLSCLDIQANRIFQANQQSETRQFSLDDWL